MQLIAKMHFPYAGRHLDAGDHFEETEEYAAILVALGKAEYVDAGVVRVKKPAESVDAPSHVALRDRALAADVEVNPQWSSARLLREVERAERHRRRDMRAED